MERERYVGGGLRECGGQGRAGERGTREHIRGGALENLDVIYWVRLKRN